MMNDMDQCTLYLNISLLNFIIESYGMDELEHYNEHAI